MAKLALSLACGPYDRMQALEKGIIQPEGIDLTYIPIQSPPEIFSRMVKGHAFDLSEMSLSLYLTMKGRGDFPFVALPVFPQRMFRHGFIFINANKGIKTPKDLNGRKVGVMQYRQTAGMWIRGALQYEYGVDLDSLEYFEGGVNAVRPPDEDMDLRPIKYVPIHHIGGSKTLDAMLKSGEIDAYFGARSPKSFDPNGTVRRLFPDYRSEEHRYFKKTGIFPIMHTLVIREELYKRQPWIAESMFKALNESKAWCLEQMRFSGSLRYMLPWLFDHIEEMDELFGADPWPYGLEPNRVTLETMARMLVDQHFLAKRLDVDDLFAPIVGWTE
jgi:4,5-dihydroxyphthalate decarboxylase